MFANCPTCKNKLKKFAGIRKNVIFKVDFSSFVRLSFEFFYDLQVALQDGIFGNVVSLPIGKDNEPPVFYLARIKDCADHPLDETKSGEYNRCEVKTMSITAKIIVFSLIGVFVVGVASYVGVVFLSPKSAPLYVAHRGYSISNPDNTPLSFAAAANKDFWGIETDIRFTKDGVPVCNHDADVKYADGTTLAIKDNDYATLRAKPLLNEKTKDNVYLCPLSEYLSCCAAGNKVAVIELKYLFSDEELAV
ncbi:MAG: hypothetical protein IKR46_02080, partial [Clostridia bacterium]|nr:hypothetical protein [Clostridia bacterium]